MLKGSTLIVNWFKLELQVRNHQPSTAHTRKLVPMPNIFKSLERMEPSHFLLTDNFQHFSKEVLPKKMKSSIYNSDIATIEQISPSQRAPFEHDCLQVSLAWLKILCPRILSQKISTTNQMANPADSKKGKLSKRWNLKQLLHSDITTQFCVKSFLFQICLAIKWHIYYL